MQIVFLKKYEAGFKVSMFGSEIYLPKQETYSAIELRAILREIDTFREVIHLLLKEGEVKLDDLKVPTPEEVEYRQNDEGVPE